MKTNNELFTEIYTIPPAFQHALERIRWNADDLIAYNSIMSFNKERGGITYGQVKLLNHLYSKYKRKNGSLK